MGFPDGIVFHDDWLAGKSGRDHQVSVFDTVIDLVKDLDGLMRFQPPTGLFG